MAKISQQLSITRTYQKPVREEKRLGSVPSDYYEGRHFLPQHGLGSIQHFENNEGGLREVVRQLPVYNADGTPKMESVTETLTEKSYDPAGRGAGCGLLGGMNYRSVGWSARSTIRR